MKIFLGCGFAQENEMPPTVKVNKDSPLWFNLLICWNISSDVTQAIPSLSTSLNLLFTAVILLFCTDQELQTTIRYDE
jgi:hypothetical protein